MATGSTCGHPAEPGRKKCRDCRRRPGRLRASRTSPRAHGKRGGPIYLALTKPEWVTLYEHQGGACYICRRQLINRYARGSDGEVECGLPAYLDHDHKLEKAAGLRASIRGLLCLHCNRYILVVLHDNADKAQRAADYLRQPPARSILDLNATS